MVREVPDEEGTRIMYLSMVLCDDGDSDGDGNGDDEWQPDEREDD